MIAYKEVKSILNKHKKRDSWFLDPEKTYGDVHYTSLKYQQELKKRGDALLRKYAITTSIR